MDKTIIVDKSTRTGSVSMSVPMGTYRIEEMNVSRYKLKEWKKTPDGKTNNAAVTVESDKNSVICEFTGTKMLMSITQAIS